MDRVDIICAVIIVLLATLFLAPALRPGYTLLPLGLEGGIAPWHKQVTQQVQNILLSDPFYTFCPRPTGRDDSVCLHTFTVADEK